LGCLCKFTRAKLRAKEVGESEELLETCSRRDWELGGTWYKV